MELTNRIYEDCLKLQNISKRLHKMDEGDCNLQRSERGQSMADTRTKRLEEDAMEIAARYGLVAYHQSDPRGCSLYLLTKEQKESGQYDQGIAIWF